MSTIATSLHPTPESLAAIAQHVPDNTPVSMVNLLRFREHSAYKPDASGAGIAGQTGRDAYAVYSHHVMPLLKGVGGKPVWMGDALCSVIAPAGESWDEVLLVEYPSKHAFLNMIQSPEYLAIVHHRTAALADSRLIATVVRA